MDRAQIGQSIELNNADRFNIEAVRRGVVQNVANFWSQMIAADKAITAHEIQIKAAETAFKGMRLEYRSGERSTLDVLIAEETLRDAELQLINSRHDLYIAKANIARQLGRLEVGIFSSQQSPYQPADHFRDVLAQAPTLARFVSTIDRLGKKKTLADHPSATEKSMDHPQPEHGDLLLQLPEKPSAKSPIPPQ